MPLVTVSIWSRVVRWSSTRGRGGGEVKKGDRTLLVRGREDPCSSMGIQCLPVEKLNWSLCQYRPRLSSLFPRTVYTCVTFLNPPRIRKAFFSLSTYPLPSFFPLALPPPTTPRGKSRRAAPSESLGRCYSFVIGQRLVSTAKIRV